MFLKVVLNEYLWNNGVGRIRLRNGESMPQRKSWWALRAFFSKGVTDVFSRRVWRSFTEDTEKILAFFA